MVASKNGYKEESVQITVDETTLTESIPQIVMTPLKALETEVYVVDKGSIRSLNSNETAYILFSNENLNFNEGIFHPINNTLNDSFELIYDDVSYTVDIKLLENQKPKGGLYLTNYTITRAQLSGAKQMRLYIMSAQKPFDNFQDFVNYWSQTVIPSSKSYVPQLR